VATGGINRRSALKFAAFVTLAAHRLWALANQLAPSSVPGYGTDPDLLQRSVTWQRTLTASQLATLHALCDIALPAELPHPSAGAIGVHEFLDEWLSAPYPQMQADRLVVLTGLATLDQTTQRELRVPFATASLPAQIALFDRACGSEATAEFSRRLIQLICTGYYATRAGHAAIGYVGNVALSSFLGPPPEVTTHFDAALAELLRATASGQ
jgi:hypothetical protein